MKQNNHEVQTNLGRMPEPDYHKMIEREARRTRQEMSRWEREAEKMEEAEKIRLSKIPESADVLYFRKGPNTERDPMAEKRKIYPTKSASNIPGDRQSRAKEINEIRRSGRKAA